MIAMGLSTTRRSTGTSQWQSRYCMLEEDLKICTHSSSSSDDAQIVQLKAKKTAASTQLLEDARTRRRLPS